MRRNLIALATMASVACWSCTQNNDHKAAGHGAVATTKMSKDSAKKIAVAEADLADKKDPVCGMPAFKYMKDTTVFRKKIYAFCSKECKVEFIKDPKQYVVK